MLRKPVVLITGAGGEIGHGLITRLAASGRQRIVTLDLTRLDGDIGKLVTREFTGSILDNALLERILAEYDCFVRPDTRIPFMAMPDAVEALLKLAAAPRWGLSRTAYNIGAFNPSADEVRARVLQAFPEAQIGFEIDTKRQGIVDSWPEDVDDSAARADWGFAPSYGFDRAFDEYLLPAIKARYTTPDA